MTVNITPLHDRVLVRRLEEKETAKGGIIIPDSAKDKPHEGKEATQAFLRSKTHESEAPLSEC